MKKYLFIFCIFLIGCATNSRYGQRFGHQLFSPKQSADGISGVLHAEPLADFKAVMEEECAVVGFRLDASSIESIDENFLGERVYSYRCLIAAETPQPTPQNTQPNFDKSTGNDTSSKSVQGPTIEPPKTQQLSVQNKNLSLSEAKKQCADLGFKAGTEKFGKCILELTK